MSEEPKVFEIKGIAFNESEIDFLRIKRADGDEIVYQKKEDKSNCTIGFGQNKS